MNTYLALTIGPIYKTIQRARKTRELWAASFALSQFMRCLLERLLPYGTALSPDVRLLGKKFHGAGIWNDNCFFHIHEDKAEILLDKEKGLLGDLIQQARKEALSLLLLENTDHSTFAPIPGLLPVLERCWHCHAVWVQRSGDEGLIMKELGELLNDPEQLSTFSPKYDDLLAAALFRRETVEALYELGYEESDRKKIFTGYGPMKQKRRLPSLLEIATREIRQHKAALYDEIVSGAISEALQERMQREKEKKASKGGGISGEDDLEDNYEDNLIVRQLKEKLNTLKIPFKKRFKYVAVVQSDGDGVGSLVRNLRTRTEIESFSGELMHFSTEAVRLIAHFGGIPVFAGGDDLLFIAPLQNEENRTVFDLVDDINKLFRNQPFLNERRATLSFGVSIAYYKYPLGESLVASRNLLQRAAKKLQYREKGASENAPVRSKHALAFRVLTHSGQSFGATLRLGTDSYEAWRALLGKKENVKDENAFTSGVMHKLEPLRFLLEDACANGLAGYFFDQHFNEAKGTVRKPFIDAVQDLSERVFAAYGELIFESVDDRWKFLESALDEKWINEQKNAWKTGYATEAERTIARQYLDSKFKINLLYSALRMIHFLNADDHE